MPFKTEVKYSIVIFVFDFLHWRDTNTADTISNYSVVNFVIIFLMLSDKLQS